MKFPNNDWQLLLKDEFEKDYFKTILKEINKGNFFPSEEDIFNAFLYTPYSQVRVVIIGQDPYHNKNEAHGLAFSTLSNKRPPSLNNIFKELESDLGIKRENNNLTDWAYQGIFLLNTSLTVLENKPLSHKKIGWEIFTDKVISLLNEKEKVIFVLWGNEAIKKEVLIDKNKHIIIKSTHPSFFSANRGFFGSKPFSRINDNLKYKIKW